MADPRRKLVTERKLLGKLCFLVTVILLNLPTARKKRVISVSRW